MNIRRLVLDVDKAVARPSVIEIAEAVEEITGVEGLNLTVTEIDIETVGMELTVEGEQIDYGNLVRAIEETGAVVHSIDELAAGRRLIEHVKRAR